MESPRGRLRPHARLWWWALISRWVCGECGLIYLRNEATERAIKRAWVRAGGLIVMRTAQVVHEEMERFRCTMAQIDPPVRPFGKMKRSLFEHDRGRLGSVVFDPPITIAPRWWSKREGMKEFLLRVFGFLHDGGLVR